MMKETRQNVFDQIETILSECRKMREQMRESQVRQQRIVDDIEQNLMPKFKAAIAEYDT